MNDNNVLDLSKRLGKQKNRSETKGTAEVAAVVDMTERRQEIISQERRQVKRTILTEFIGACVVVPNKGLMKVTVYDISENGISFDMDEGAGFFREGEEIAMRVYMNHQTYFGFIVTVQNVRLLETESVIRLGAHFVKGSVNDKALQHFVKFIEEVSASLERDTGDVMVSNLKR